MGWNLSTILQGPKKNLPQPVILGFGRNLDSYQSYNMGLWCRPEEVLTVYKTRTEGCLCVLHVCVCNPGVFTVVLTDAQLG